MPRAALPNFSKGEISPELYGRIDTAQYSAGLKTARNWIVQKYGGVSFRPGSRLVGKWDETDQPLKFIPFQFSIDQSYVLAMGQGFMRPLALGGFVVEQNTEITGIALGNPTVLEVPFHGYDVGDRIYLSGIVGTTELNGRFALVTDVPDADHVEIDVDSTGFGAFVSSDGTLNAGPPPAPPAPPAVPPVVDPPAEPEVGGSEGYDYEWDGRYTPGWAIP